MQTYPGVFIVLEGSDGSGKTTQFELLKKRLIDNGYDVEVFDFPRYDKASSHFVQRYLNGQYGPAAAISPYTASLFFALDRYEAGIDIKEALAAGKVVLSNRYVGSNMAHQGAKFNDPVEKRSFFVWEDSLEFQLLNIPRPNINIFLRVPAEVSYELIKQKAARNYTELSHDEHEADMNHLKRSVETYDLLCELFPKDYMAIDCVANSKLEDIETINSKIWKVASEYLPEPPQKETPEIKKRKDFIGYTPEEPATSEPNPADNGAHEFKWRIKRLSLQAASELSKMGHRLEIDWQSSWNGDGTNYDFYIPDSLSKDLLVIYKAAYINAIAEHQKIYQKLHQSAKQINNRKNATQLSSKYARRAIPMGALLQVSINLNKDEFGDVLTRLRAHNNPEIAALEPKLAQAIDSSGIKTASSKTDDKTPAAPAPLNEIINQLALSKLPQNLSDVESPVLVSASPRNEFELLADGLYSLSDLTRDDILLALDNWTYQQKAKALAESLASNPELLLIPTYKIDAITDRVSVLEIAAALPDIKITTQQPTVRYGYDVPSQVEECGAEDVYMELFDSFLELFNSLQSSSGESNLPYATLSGHKIRWQISVNAKSLKALYQDVKDSVAKEVVAAFKNVVGEAHPQIASWLNRNPNQSSKPSQKRRPKKKKH